MSQIGYNSGLNGKIRTPSTGSAPGLWSLQEQNNYRRAGTWPTTFASPISFNPLIWYDASDANSVQLDSGDPAREAPAGPAVMVWNDKSGNNRHMLQTESVRRPAYVTGAVNGNNVLRFPDRNLPPYLVTDSFTAIEPREVYSIVQYAYPSFPGAHYATVLSHTNASGQPWITSRGSTELYGPQAPSYYFNNGHYLNALNGEASTADRSSNVFPEIASTCLIRSVADSSEPVRVPVTKGYVVGNDRLYTDVVFSGIGYRFWTGYICEIIGYAEPLNKTNRDFLATYLCDKWGIPQYTG